MKILLKIILEYCYEGGKEKMIYSFFIKRIRI